jgi:hypothetical protein
MSASALNELPANRPIRLKNVICPYCGVVLTKATSTRDHVIARGFVPKGTLEDHWNLIVNACQKCNVRKSDLEDDISAITMQPDVLGRHFGNHPQLALDAAHKARRAHSRYTKKLVGDSSSKVKIRGRLMGCLDLTFDLVGQPQISDERAFELALRHFQAFFFFITYDHQKNRGFWWKGSYAPIQVVSRTDWGNALACRFMEETHSWEHRVLAVSAEGHFKQAIRKHPIDVVWSLTAEWNENFRILAACGDDASLQRFLQRLPKLELKTVFQSQDAGLKVRTEKPLAEEADTLFVPPPAFASAAEQIGAT